jgi:hypothetical protein
LDAFSAAFIAEWNQLILEHSGNAEAKSRELATVERKLANLIDRIAEGLHSATMQKTLNALEERKAALASEIAASPLAVPALHPNLAAVYQTKVAGLRQAMSGANSTEVIEAARELVDRIIVSPPEDDGGPPGIELVGDLIAMLRTAGLQLAGKASTKQADAFAALISSVKGDSGGYLPPTLPSSFPQNRQPHRSPPQSRAPHPPRARRGTSAAARRA